MKKRLACVIGIDLLEGRGERFEPSIRSDAAYVRARVGNFKPVLSLTGREAAKSRILESLDRDILLRAGWNDKVLIYYSGIGATAGTSDAPKFYLLPYDFKEQAAAAPGAEKSGESPVAGGGTEGAAQGQQWGDAISIGELAGLFSRQQVRAERVLVIIDAAFNGDAPRTLAHLDAPAADASPGAILSGAFASRKTGSLFVMTACDDAATARQSASSIDLGQEGGMGLFTYYLRKGLRQGPKAGFLAADLNEDRQVTVLELFGYVQKGVEQISQLEGTLQTPELWLNGRRFSDDPRVRAVLKLASGEKTKAVSALATSELKELMRLGLDFPVFTYEINDRAKDEDAKVVLR